MLIDANVLLYAVDATSPFNERAAAWMESALSGDIAVGFPWQSIGAFVRIVTHPRISDRPLSGAEAWQFVDEWLSAPNAWIPPASESTARILAGLADRLPITGNLVPDAQLAALAIEFGVVLVSCDGDFARFPGLRWINPLAVE